MIPYFASLFQNQRRAQRTQRGRQREPRRARRRASATVETALCLTFVLLPVTLGGFQFAMIYMTQHAMQQVARESVRWAAVHYNDDNFDGLVTKGDGPRDTTKPNGPREDRSLLNYMREQAAANGIAWKDISGERINRNPTTGADQKGGSITVVPADDQRLSGQPITITITYPMRQRSFLGSLLFKSNDGKKVTPLSLGIFKSDFVEASTTLME